MIFRVTFNPMQSIFHQSEGIHIIHIDVLITIALDLDKIHSYQFKFSGQNHHQSELQFLFTRKTWITTLCNSVWQTWLYESSWFDDKVLVLFCTKDMKSTFFWWDFNGYEITTVDEQKKLSFSCFHRIWRRKKYQWFNVKSNVLNQLAPLW